jgi:hypothetical protein
VAGPLYFAWADATELTSFGAGHQVEDEEVFSLEIAHAEGEFATATVDVRNPKVGLLGPGRKRWAWFSWRDPDGVVHPLLFGRLVGVPENIQDELVRLTFVARPADYDAQLTALADTLRVLPYYDPVWFSADERTDPDKVLEARTQLWHVDRVTLEVTASDIVQGEDGTVAFGGADAFYDSVSVSYSGSPARTALVEATVQWDQTGAGEIDLGPALRLAFAGVQAGSEQWIDGVDHPTSMSTVNMVDGKSMIDAWPAEGAGIGGGWSVGRSSIKPLLAPPGPAVFMPGAQYDVIAGSGLAPSLPASFSGGGFQAKILDVQNGDSISQIRGSYDVMWVPIWRMAATLTAVWEAKRARAETVSFQMDADVQPVLSDPDDDEVLRIKIGPAYVDTRADLVPGGSDTEDSEEAPLDDLRRASYFKTPRGVQSFEHVLARARAQLVARARCVDVRFEIPFALAVGLSCRKSGTLADARLPGATAGGKIKAYSMSVDGDTGAMIGSVVLGCTAGRDGSFEASAGLPSYVEEGYVESGYQAYDGQTFELLGAGVGQVGYEYYGSQAIDDDGVDLTNVTALGYIVSASVTGGRQSQQDVVAPNAYNRFGSIREVVDRLSAVTTSVRVELTPVTGGPFNTVLAPVVSQLTLPRGVDLEAE